MTLRVAVDGRPLRHPHTGIGVYTREVLRRLGERCQLFVYLDRATTLPDIKATFRLAPTAAPPTGIPRTNLQFPRGVWNLLDFVDDALGHLRANFQFPRWAREDRAEVFWSPRHHLPLGIGAMPTVVTIHDLVWRVLPRTMRPLNRLLDATLMPWALKRADRVIAVSEHTRAGILRFCGRGDAEVTPLGAVTVAKPIPFHHPRPFFLFVGTREPRKNLAGILRGFRWAVEAGLKDHDLVLVGNTGWGRAGLAPPKDADGLAARLVDLGELPDARLAGVYAAATGLVLASFHEGFGLPLLEAMHHGKPAIVSNVGPLPEIAADAALLVEPTRPEDIGAAFSRLAGDRALAARLGANARRRAAHFSWETTAAQTLETLAAAPRR